MTNDLRTIHYWRHGGTSRVQPPGGTVALGTRLLTVTRHGAIGPHTRLGVAHVFIGGRS